METTATKDRAALVADLERLGEEHTARLAPLTSDVKTAEAAFEDVDRQLDTARGELGVARAAVSVLSSRCSSERSVLADELHRSAPASIGTFRAWCKGRIADLQAGPATPESRSQVAAAHGAMQQIAALELMADDDLEPLQREALFALENLAGRSFRKNRREIIGWYRSLPDEVKSQQISTV